MFRFRSTTSVTESRRHCAPGQPSRWLKALAIGAATLAATFAADAATSVSLGARMGDKAVLVINGRPRAMAVGGSEQGVRLLSLGSDSAQVEVDGQRITLRMGATPIDLSGEPSPGGGTRVVLSMGSGGHFGGAGSINGKPVNFMIDTGATLVAMSQGEADRIGLRYQNAPRGLVQTANGMVPVHSVRLASLRIGDVLVRDVEAVVMPASMRQVLLGNSFLTRFQMRRDNTTMTLDKIP